MRNDLLEFFSKRMIPIQITLDVRYHPTVHAIHHGIHKTSGITVDIALENMKQVILGLKGEEDVLEEKEDVLS